MTSIRQDEPAPLLERPRSWARTERVPLAPDRAGEHSISAQKLSPMTALASEHAIHTNPTVEAEP